MKNKIIQGDVIDITKTLLAESINCIITSPPYFGLRDYDLPPTHWPAVFYAPMAGLPPITIPAMSCCFGLEDSIEAYVGHMVLVFRELWRVLRGDGVAWLNLGDSYASQGGPQVDGTKQVTGSQNGAWNGLSRNGNGLPPKNLCGIPWRVAFALQADGWYLRSDVIWAKKNCLPESVRDRPTKAHEYLFLLAKSERYWWDQEAIREPHKPNSLTRWKPGTPKIESENTKNSEFSKTQYGATRVSEKSGDLLNSAGRNKRTVWPIATKPFPGAHFAVMPESLVEPCLSAGCPAQVCAECGEPWVRVVEKETFFEGGSGKAGRTADEVNAKGKWAGKQYGTNIKLGPVNRVKTIAHAPTCQCSAPTRPGIALDPFFGSGTVGVVAKKLKRDFIGIELNPDYIKMATSRLNKTQSALFAL